MRCLKSYLLIACLGLISLLALADELGVIARASASLQEKEAVWERYTAQGEEFSVMMPELPGVISRYTCLNRECDKRRQEYDYAAYGDGGVYLVTSYENPKGRQSLKEIIEESLDSFGRNFETVPQGDVKLNGFSGKKYLLTSKSGSYERVIVYYLTGEHVYEVQAVNENRNDAAVQKFFESFTLGEKTGKDIGNGARHDSLSIPVKTPAPAGKDAPPVSSDTAQTIFKPQELTRKAAVVFKPTPGYTDKARQNMLTGTVVLQMVLSSSGRVTNIRTVSGLPFGLTEEAIRAARKIYFIPAVKDGKRVSQYVRVEYNFNIY